MNNEAEHVLANQAKRDRWASSVDGSGWAVGENEPCVIVFALRTSVTGKM